MKTNYPWPTEIEGKGPVRLLKGVTLGISCYNNTEALQMTLASVLAGSLLPEKILLRFEGQIPGFATFYMEQLTAVARLHGIDLQIAVGDPKGIRATRQWQVENCTTTWMWFLDDDVIAYDDTLRRFYAAMELHQPGSVPLYFQGSKADVNNRRGYGNFDLTWNYVEEMSCPDGHGAGYNWLWISTPGESLKSVVVVLADMGNILVNITQFKDLGMNFITHTTHTNAGGEDTVFGLMARHVGATSYWVPRAQVFHLEKPGGPRMSEHAYRKELVMRENEGLGKPLSDEEISALVLPWEPIHRFGRTAQVTKDSALGI